MIVLLENFVVMMIFVIIIISIVVMVFELFNEVKKFVFEIFVELLVGFLFVLI